MAARLSLLTWPDYIAPATLERFQAETGIEVALETVPSAVEVIARMQSPGPHPDLLVPPDYAVRELAAAGRLMTLDEKRLPGLRHLMPEFRRERAHDPEGLVSVAKDWGTTGFMYRTDVVEERPTSWREFWHLAEKYRGRVVVLDSPGEVLGAALKMRGHSYNDSEPAHLAEARADLLRLKPTLLAFETNYKPLFESGEAALALGWNGDAAALQGGDLPVRYVIPEEGSQLWEDDWAISSDAAHPEEAHAFIEFMLRPEVAAQEARYTRYATGNAAAFEMLDEALRGDPATYPPPEVMAKLEAALPHEEAAARRRSEVWRAVRG
jgi:spermidine/putrescine transport system substrate-binding protein